MRDRTGVVARAFWGRGGVALSVVLAALVAAFALSGITDPAHAQAPACGTAVDTAKTALVADCTALLGMKSALLGTKTTEYQLNWAANTPIANWKGVGIENDRVVSLDLSTGHKVRKKQLRGTLPSGIGSLTALEKLDLGRNSLTGALPAELGQLPKLKVLILKRNKFSGAFPTFSTPETLKVVRIMNISDLTGCFPAEWTANDGKTTKLTKKLLDAESTAIDACSGE